MTSLFPPATAGGRGRARPSPDLRRVVLVWAVQQPGHFSWASDEVCRCVAAANVQTSDAGPLLSLDVRVYVTQGARGAVTALATRANVVAEHGALAILAGRPSVARALEEAAHTVAAEDAALYVVACGPAALVRQTWDGVTSLRRRGHGVTFASQAYSL